MNFKYVIAANGSKAVVVHSGLNCMEMDEYVRRRSRKIHEDGNDVIFRLGGIELVNPYVMAVDDFANRLPHLIHPE